MLESKSVFPLRDVAVLMMANEENTFIESIIRGLAPKVGQIFLVEGEKNYAGTGERDGQVEGLFKRLVSSGVTNLEHFIAKHIGTPNPAINETHMRNEALDAIQRKGYKWVWIVDSDEVYTDADAEGLWKHFLDVLRGYPLRGAKCSMYTYWRSLYWRIDPPEPHRPNVIIRSDCRFSLVRTLANEQDFLSVPPDVCMMRHYSWVKSPADVQKKIKGWGHAHQLLPDWFENVFSKWEPDCHMENLHPTEPAAYKRAVRCDLPLPEMIQGHPYTDIDVVDCDDHASPNIKVIILNHNKPENADKLFDELSPVFDVEIWDSGSDCDKIPINVTRSYPNIYWGGAWDEIMRIYSEYDVVWMIGCDIELKCAQIEYRRAIEEYLPFGCWSPCIVGRAHPFMRAEKYTHHKPVSVKNIEGMAMAVSGELMRKVKKLPSGSPMGFGQDFWLCYEARKNGLKNIIDGSVVVFHPPEIGYDLGKAMKQMDDTFTSMYGKNYRQNTFQYDERYEGNLMSENTQRLPVVSDFRRDIQADHIPTRPLRIVTVDNGWGYEEFLRCTNGLPANRVVISKGVAELTPVAGVEIVKYDEWVKSDPAFTLLLNSDIAFLPKIGASNKTEYEQLLYAGVSVVTHTDHSSGLIEHMKTGFVYQNEQWAVHWLKELVSNEMLRKEVRNNLFAHRTNPIKTSLESQMESALVTVITPTYKRDPKIIRRCIDCMKLQTYANWEQLICSDGGPEEHVKELVKEIADPRIQYLWTGGKKDGDYGNTVRSEMLKVRARGEYVLFFDDDNIILPNYLRAMVVRLQNAPDCGFAVCRVMHFGPLNEAVVGKPPIVLKSHLVKLYHIDPLQVLVRTEAMKKIGWDTTVGYLSDGVTLEKLGNQYRHVQVGDVLGVHM